MTWSRRPALEAEQVVAIRKQHEKGVSYAQLSRDYAVSINVIIRACQRITYKYIKDADPMRSFPNRLMMKR